MEHSIHSLHAASAWRTRALVAAAVAAVELLVLLLIALTLAARSFSADVQEAARHRVLTQDRPTPARPERTTPAAPKLARGETSVVVLNGNGRQGAAAETAARLRGIGYMIGSVGNAPRSDYGKSVVMYRPGHKPEGRRLARDLKIKIVGPLDGLRLRDLMGAHVAVLIGN